MPEERESPRGRAVGDEDATGGPMDDLPPGLADGADKASVETASIEEDRAKSSGRPPVAAERAARDRKARASRHGKHPTPPRGGYRSKPRPQSAPR